MAAGLILTVGSQASTITYDFDHTFTGVPPEGPTPWLTAQFSDTSQGAVQLTLAAPGLMGTEAVNQWYFNLNPALDPKNLIFTQTAASQIPGLGVAAGADAFKPNWDGKYDIMFNFAPGSFGAGISMTFTITGVDGLKAADFLFLNTPTAGHGSLYAAANIQTIGEAVIIDSDPRVESNDAAPVPDGGTTVLLLSAATLLVETARRRLRIFCQ